MTQNEALRLALEALEKLWNIIDDIDTYSDMAKADEKLYRSLVERRQRQRFEETGISTDGYELHGGAITAIKAALEAKDEPVAFKIYKPTPPRGAIPNVRDAELPWVYDQDPSSGNVASMWVTPVKAIPPQRPWVGLSNGEMIELSEMQLGRWDLILEVEAKLKEKNT